MLQILAVRNDREPYGSSLFLSLRDPDGARDFLAALIA